MMLTGHPEDVKEKANGIKYLYAWLDKHSDDYAVVLTAKARLQVEAEMLVQGPNHVDAETIKSQATDLKAILEEADLMTRRHF